MTSLICLSGYCWAMCEGDLEPKDVKSSVTKKIDLASEKLLNQLTSILLELHWTYPEAVLRYEVPLEAKSMGASDVVVNRETNDPLSAIQLRNLLKSNLTNHWITNRLVSLLNFPSEEVLEYFFAHADDYEVENLASNFSLNRSSRHSREGRIQALRILMKKEHENQLRPILPAINLEIQNFHISEFMRYANYGVGSDKFKEMIREAKKAAVDLNQGLNGGPYSHVIQLYIEPSSTIRERLKKVEALLEEGGIDLNVVTNAGKPLAYVLEDLRNHAATHPDRSQKEEWQYYYRDQRHLIALFLNDRALDLEEKAENGKLLYINAIEPRSPVEDLPEIREMLKFALRRTEPR